MPQRLSCSGFLEKALQSKRKFLATGDSLGSLRMQPVTGAAVMTTRTSSTKDVIPPVVVANLAQRRSRYPPQRVIFTIPGHSSPYLNGAALDELWL